MKIDTLTNRLTYRGRLVKGKTSGVKTILVQNSHKGGVQPGIATHSHTAAYIAA